MKYLASFRNAAICSLLIPLLFLMVGACNRSATELQKKDEMEQKIVVYQVFARLFGNTVTTNRAWGTLEENGVGKFAGFTDRALGELKELGVTHIWYTGVLHHAMVTDYADWGLPGDDPDVVKGRAGSPYAVKDYYNVDPDLATDPARRMEEFEALIQRTHRHGLKVIIDMVPNHVARGYHSVSNPEGCEDFGASDDRSVEYRRDNNFYYIPGEPFRVPVWKDGYRVLGGEPHPLADGFYDENPARWTGNGSRSAQPDMHDWYETVKINYGVRPDGTRDFDMLPPGFENEGPQAHHDFWDHRQVPDSWTKFRDIALYWLDRGVDGFRYDMAEMVPVEFWSYMNSAIKLKKPDAFLLGEIYQPPMYRDFIRKGLMDFLYDKVELYDTLKLIVQGHGSTDLLSPILEGSADIEHHLLRFLENHDEQRIASPEFAGDPWKGMPAMVVSATAGSGPVMIYFGQEVGEPGDGDPGFGSHSRTTIYDYWGVPNHQRWMNGGAFDGGQLSSEEHDLRECYRKLLKFTRGSSALTGAWGETHRLNREQAPGYNDRVYSFARWSDEEKVLVVANFDAIRSCEFDMRVPGGIISSWALPHGEYDLEDQLSDKVLRLKVAEGSASVGVHLTPLESLILVLKPHA